MHIQMETADEVSVRLAAAAAETGKSLQELTREALLSYREDGEDSQLALEGLKSDEMEGTVSLGEVVRKLGLLN